MTVSEGENEMTVPLGVMSVFVGLAIWACLAVYAVLRGRYLPVLRFDIAKERIDYEEQNAKQSERTPY